MNSAIPYLLCLPCHPLEKFASFSGINGINGITLGFCHIDSNVSQRSRDSLLCLFAFLSISVSSSSISSLSSRFFLVASKILSIVLSRRFYSSAPSPPPSPPHHHVFYVNFRLYRQTPSVLLRIIVLRLHIRPDLYTCATNQR